MKKIVVLMIIAILTITLVSACSQTKSNYVSGQAYNSPYTPPPSGQQGGGAAVPQPLAAGGGCGV